MFRYVSFIILFHFFNIASAQITDRINFQREATYGSTDDASLPLWVRKMYEPNPNVGEVVQLYHAYYASNPFVKNTHTQYYKRWIKNTKGMVDDQGLVNPPSKAEMDRIFNERFRLNNSGSAERSVTTQPNWTSIGPFDFDKDAAGRSHAPGAAHVYTIEKAPSNPDILYCGTANAGVWKTVDRGVHWTYASASIPINYCNALEVHPTDPNTVWIGANNRVYMTTNGGSTWTQIGDVLFNSVSHTIDDIALKPGTTNILFVASNKGLYKSEDGGNNFVKLINIKGNYGAFAEIEFKPNDPNTVYALHNDVNDLYTELYKSTDGGTSFSVVSSWPVLASASSYQYKYVGKSATTNQYVAFVNNNLGTISVPNFTIEMRVKFPTSSADKAFLSNKNWTSGQNNGWVIGSRYTGELTFNAGNGTSRIDLNTSSIWDDNWHQVSVVYRATGTKELYVDGVLKASSTSNITMTATSLPMILGRDGNLGYGALDMHVDEFRIWSTALASTEINNWKYVEVNNSHPNYSNLLHYYKCNETSGNQLIDAQSASVGTMNAAWDRKTSSWGITTTNLPTNDHQKRGEIAVTAANPNKIYALLAGSAYGGSGLFGFYESTDAGTTWTHKCCGTGPGGAVSSSNPNLLGYSATGSEEGGQYYYDLALDADPANANKVHIAGINPWYSANSGVTFTNVGHWANPSGSGYVHADVHNIEIYGNEVWTVSDGGIFMSQDSGKVMFTKRQFGISGTDFWGFGMGHKDANVMLGGTYHNSHLMKNNDVYINGWVSYTGSADGTRGFVNPGKNKVVYNDSGRDILPNSRTQNPTYLPFYKKPNTFPHSKVTWDPRCYNCVFTGNESGLWYSPNDGYSWTLVHDFSPYDVVDIEIAWDDPNIIWVTGSNPDGFYDPKKIWKSSDRGATWTDVTPSSNALGFPSPMWFNITLGDNHNEVWMNVFHIYWWYWEYNNKMYYSNDGGNTWTNISHTLLNNQNINDVVYQRGSNGGIYVGSSVGVYYKDHTTNGFVPFSTGLPLNISTTKLFPWYYEGKIRLGSNQSAWESPLYKISPPIAQPMVDKLSSLCVQDTFYFKDYSAHYKTNASFQWTFDPAPSYVSSSTIDSPKVVFGNAGNYTVILTVSDSVGVSTDTLVGGILVSNNGCNLDTISGKCLALATNGEFATQQQAMGFSSNNLTLSAWIKPTAARSDLAGLIFCRGSNTAATGLHLTASNELRYHWQDGKYNYSSGMIVPTNEWSHVALVVTPTQATLYLNGRSVTNVSTHNTINFLDPFNFGVDPTSYNRTFIGLMDEACIYNRALSTTEIRELMHLTRNPANDAALKAYYQFNTQDPYIDIDKVSNNNLFLNLSATKVKSTAPVGKGTSHTINVTSGGLKHFSNAHLKMYFPTSGTYPSGNVVVSKINQLPDTFPTGGIVPHAYWVINNYGTNASFSMLDSITFTNSGNIFAGYSPTMYQLFKRNFNGEGLPSWGGPQDLAEYFNPNGTPLVTFGANNRVISDGQYFVLNNNTPSNDPEICNGIDDNCNGLIDETYALLVTNNADNGLNTLRQILDCAQDGDTIRFAAAVDTITLLSPLTLTKDVMLLDEIGNKVVLKLNLNLPSFTGAEAGFKIEQSSAFSTENIEIRHTNNSSSKPIILNLGQWTVKNCVIDGEPVSILLQSPNSNFNAKGDVLIK